MRKEQITLTVRLREGETKQKRRTPEEEAKKGQHLSHRLVKSISLKLSVRKDEEPDGMQRNKRLDKFQDLSAVSPQLPPSSSLWRLSIYRSLFPVLFVGTNDFICVSLFSTCQFLSHSCVISPCQCLLQCKPDDVITLLSCALQWQ